jgi:hypothetical protein
LAADVDIDGAERVEMTAPDGTFDRLDDGVHLCGGRCHRNCHVSVDVASGPLEAAVNLGIDRKSGQRVELPDQIRAGPLVGGVRHSDLMSAAGGQRCSQQREDDVAFHDPGPLVIW